MVLPWREQEQRESVLIPSGTARAAQADGLYWGKELPVLTHPPTAPDSLREEEEKPGECQRG